MVHEMKLRRYYFDKIKCGEKIYELRLNDEKRRKISIGDQILFRDHETEKQEMLVEVDDSCGYKENLLVAENLFW